LQLHQDLRELAGILDSWGEGVTGLNSCWECGHKGSLCPEDGLSIGLGSREGDAECWGFSCELPACRLLL
jgi:hypothetical protein